MAAISRGDAWAAGSYCPGSACKVNRPLLQHWNGKTWATVSI